MTWHVTINLPLEISLPLGFDIRVSVHRYYDFFNYNQQDTTTFDYLFLKGSTCSGRFLHPLS